MWYYVRLCLEGLPLHLWSENFVVAVLGRSCALQFEEESSQRRESTDVFELLAWMADPIIIPLRVWLSAGPRLQRSRLSQGCHPQAASYRTTECRSSTPSISTWVPKMPIRRWHQPWRLGSARRN
jgi:hypothetical protein